jgi:light-regulated signal transduction histidine kinase (bacteriophytochrome)
VETIEVCPGKEHQMPAHSGKFVSYYRVSTDKQGKLEAFRPFYRVEGSRSRDSGGTGLGLTVARNVARAHGGDVVLSGRAEGGLRATIVPSQNDVPFSPQWTGIPEQKR